MRQLSIALLTASLFVALPAMAQDAWSVSDPQCDPQVLADTMTTVQKQQELSAKDAQAVNDYYKKIKEGVSDANGKLLSCVDVSWPDLPFSGMLPMVEQFIKNVGDKAVAEGCDKIRDSVRGADSLFNTDSLKGKVLGSLGDAGTYAGDLIDGKLPNIPGVPKIPGFTGQNNPPPFMPPSGGSGGVGGLIDLIRPRPKTPPGQTPPGQTPPPAR